MDAYSGYVYTAMWLILAIYMFYQAVKNYKFFFVLSGFFLFMSGWYLANELLAVDLFSGVYSWIFRGVAVVVLIACVIAYICHRKNPTEGDSK